MGMNITPPTSSLNQFIFKLIKPHQGLIAMMGLIGLLWAFINTFSPYVLKLIIDHAVHFHEDSAALLKTTLPYVAIYIGFWIALFLNMRFLDWVKLKLFPAIRSDVMNNMFGYLQQHSHHYFQNHLAGSLVNKIIDMQQGIIEIFTILDDVYAQACGLTIATITLLFVHPLFAFLLSGWALVFLLITFVFLKPTQTLAEAFSASKSTVVGRMVDSIGNILNVRLFSRFTEEHRYINDSIHKAVTNDRAMQAKIIKMRLCWDISMALLVGLNIIVLLNLYSQHRVSIGDFTFVITLSMSILWNLWFLAGQFVSFSQNLGYCKQAFTIISKPHDIVDSPHAKPLVIQKGQIEFNNVTFHYDEGTQLFQNKNIMIEGGQKVGLVGFSGSGKSTFINLILRLFEVESGEIAIDQQNINTVTQQSLREQIALVPQDITLFHRTLMENIQFGNPRATETEIIAASKKAHCHEFIMQLQQGYQSIVGERGIKLSSGQRQRVAIARAILKNAPIFILDEATSALDSVTERYIQEALDILMQGKTTIVIAHRLSTLAKMNRILVFDQGKIVEDGTHDALLVINGHYAKMWRMQAGGFLPRQDKEKMNKL